MKVVKFIFYFFIVLLICFNGVFSLLNYEWKPEVAEALKQMAKRNEILRKELLAKKLAYTSKFWWYQPHIKKGKPFLSLVDGESLNPIDIETYNAWLAFRLAF